MRRDEVTFWLPGIEWSGAALAPEPADAAERRRALDPESSFIVRAPAGSGKTELLIQRFLVLLARVEQPESIAAITFTVKAAGEMRSRVLDALRKARANAAGDTAQERLTIELASEALARDERLAWGLLHNPDRLRIQTIDALCMAITRQMPWLARFGAMPRVIEDAREMYRDAARQSLELLGRDDALGRAAACLIAHLDNNVAGVEGLLARMLETRDHWLRVMAFGADPAHVRSRLEGALQNVICDHLTRLRASLPGEHAAELLQLARYAGANVHEGEIACCRALDGIPGCTADDLERWTGLSKLLLTGKNEWRKQADRRIGFPPANRRLKDRFDHLMRLFEKHEHFRELLASVKDLPRCSYEESQWQVLAALFRLLPVTVAHLRTVFAETGTVDFIEIAAAARRALGDIEQPTDLALAMGSRIEHLLVDEFQDTSVTQFELLRALTAGWDEGRRRTLFLVGDPMQSIYRFRQAEVGLFLNVQQSGLGALQPESLSLSVNFRSARSVVEWVNETFRGVFPATPDPHTGAVPYAASTAFRDGSAEPGVEFHSFIGRDDPGEAELVGDLIDAESRAAGTGGIAVLVRARAHLAAIAQHLRDRGRRYRAIEIHALAEKPVIQDLLALTRALLHLGDRAAWLSILRAPWCGLTLADLHALAAPDLKRTIWDLIRTPAGALSPDGISRLAHVLPVLSEAIERRGRVPAVQLVERAWTGLGGPGLVDDNEMSDARAYFDLLDEMGAAGDIADFDRLATRVEDLFANPDTGEGIAVELMTIHKAKGLEFDTVILPGLGKRPRPDDPTLLLWSERPAGGSAELLMAPIAATSDNEDRTYAFIRREEAVKSRHESRRLLYVACTRAKRRLHLIGHAEIQMDGDTACLADPLKDSLLAHLWPSVRAQFEEHFLRAGAQEIVRPRPSRTPRPLKRIALADRPVAVPEPVQAPDIPNPFVDARDSDAMRRIGTTIHRVLEQIAREGLPAWTPERVSGLRRNFEVSLDAAGSDDPAAEAARVQAALIRTLEDERGRWILSPHEQARSELALTGAVGRQVRHYALDRTFVDGGIRWIVDFKTGEPVSLEAVRREYQEQLEAYAAVVGALDPHPVRAGLYFPVTGDWIEWDPSGG